MKPSIASLFVALSLSACGGTVCVVHKDGTETCEDEGESESPEDQTCEEVAADVLERVKQIFAACDVPTEIVEEPVPVCDEMMKQTLICYDDCLDLLTCGAITGEDLDAITAYADCTFGCAP
jgi:hypothetical protein